MISKIRIAVEDKTSFSYLVKPQYYDSSVRAWKDFENIQVTVPKAKYGGAEISYLSEKRIGRAKIKIDKWIKEWRQENNSNAQTVKFESLKSEKPQKAPKKKKKKKEIAKCVLCNRKVRVTTTPRQNPKQIVCMYCVISKAD